MKSLIPILVLFTFFAVSCNQINKKQSDPSKPIAHDSVPIARKCATMTVLREHLAKDSLMAGRMQSIEKFTQRHIALFKTQVDAEHDTLTIPVVVNVIHSNSNENISEEQIRSQITVLNHDFARCNADKDQIPEEFSALAADIKIRFDLKKINSKFSTRTEWGTNDEMKFLSSGGIDAADPEGHLNIWVCNIGGGILGYAQFPGDNPLTDGIVISPQFFGTTGFVQAPFNKGRTATHEVGHWLNLRHIWGDGGCDQDDFISDTPASDRPNNGCPEYPTVHCDSNDMTMNYMDYVDDACMYMFSEGQKLRMRAVFEAGGPRASFLE